MKLQDNQPRGISFPCGRWPKTWTFRFYWRRV